MDRIIDLMIISPLIPIIAWALPMPFIAAAVHVASTWLAIGSGLYIGSLVREGINAFPYEQPITPAVVPFGGF